MGAALLDQLMVIPMYIGASMLFIVLGLALSEDLRRAERADSDWGTRVGFFSLLFLVPIGMFVYLWIGNAIGQTFGKRRNGLRVVMRTGARPGVLRGFVRTLAMPAIWAPAFPWAALLFAGISDAPGPLRIVALGIAVLCYGDLFLAFNVGNRSLHDRAAETWVVKAG